MKQFLVLIILLMLVIALVITWGRAEEKAFVEFEGKTVSLDSDKGLSIDVKEASSETVLGLITKTTLEGTLIVVKPENARVADIQHETPNFGESYTILWRYEDGTSSTTSFMVAELAPETDWRAGIVSQSWAIKITGVAVKDRD